MTDSVDWKTIKDKVVNPHQNNNDDVFHTLNGLQVDQIKSY